MDLRCIVSSECPHEPEARLPLMQPCGPFGHEAAPVVAPAAVRPRRNRGHHPADVRPDSDSPVGCHEQPAAPQAPREPRAGAEVARLRVQDVDPQGRGDEREEIAASGQTLPNAELNVVVGEVAGRARPADVRVEIDLRVLAEIVELRRGS